MKEYAFVIIGDHQIVNRRIMDTRPHCALKAAGGPYLERGGVRHNQVIGVARVDRTQTDTAVSGYAPIDKHTLLCRMDSVVVEHEVTEVARRRFPGAVAVRSVVTKDPERGAFRAGCMVACQYVVGVFDPALPLSVNSRVI